MKIEILGPARMVSGKKVLDLPPGKIRILLRVLAIRTGRTVTSDELIGELWAGVTPSHAAEGLYVYVSRLRKLIHRFADGGGPSIVTANAGYRFDVGAHDVDLLLFKRLIRDGRRLLASGQHHEAAQALEAALAQCRDTGIGELGGGPIITGFQPWLEEVHTECTEMLFDAKLMQGQHRHLIADLYALTQRHPLRENFYRQLMLALFRSDRQADALAVYRRARTSLNEHLGVEPARALQELQRAILSADEQLYLHAG